MYQGIFNVCSGSKDGLFNMSTVSKEGHFNMSTGATSLYLTTKTVRSAAIVNGHVRNHPRVSYQNGYYPIVWATHTDRKRAQ